MLTLLFVVIISDQLPLFMFTLSSQVLFEALTSEPSYDNYRERGPSLVRILSVPVMQQSYGVYASKLHTDKYLRLG